MQSADLDLLCRREKAITAKLREVADLTGQLARAVDRNDETSVVLLLTMREEPLTRMAEMDEALRQSLLQLPQADAVRARELLEGGAAEEDAEAELVRLSAQYRSLLKTVQDMDRRVSLRVGGKRSFYDRYK